MKNKLLLVLIALGVSITSCNDYLLQHRTKEIHFLEQKIDDDIIGLWYDGSKKGLMFTNEHNFSEFSLFNGKMVFFSRSRFYTEAGKVYFLEDDVNSKSGPGRVTSCDYRIEKDSLYLYGGSKFIRSKISF